MSRGDNNNNSNSNNNNNMSGEDAELGVTVEVERVDDVDDVEEVDVGRSAAVTGLENDNENNNDLHVVQGGDNHSLDNSNGSAGSAGRPVRIIISPPSDEPQARPQANDTANNANVIATRRLRCLLSVMTCPIIPLIFCLLGLMIYVFVAAFFVDRDKPCDQPLKEYAIFSTCIAVYTPLHKTVKRLIFNYSRERDGSARPLRVRIFDELFQGCILTWIWVGVAFVSDCNTCPDTAPDLYKATRSFVIVLVLCLGLLVLPLLFLPCIYLWLVRSGALSPGVVMNQAAPPDVLEHLTCIEYDPASFDDTMNPRECCICMNEFGDEETGDDVIVRTECGHVFHKACLGGWLATSRHCPLCRENLASHYERSVENRNHRRSRRQNTADGNTAAAAVIES